jgi:hypothetical protein
MCTSARDVCCCILCPLDYCALGAVGEERQQLIKRIFWGQVLLTISIIIVSGVLIVATDFYLKLVLGIVNSCLATALKFTSSFDKDIRDTSQKLDLVGGPDKKSEAASEAAHRLAVAVQGIAGADDQL